MGFRVAVVGATGAVGREILKILAERDFPVSDIAALASGRSVGQEVSFGDKRVLKIQALDKFDFAGWDIGLFSPGAAVSAIHAPRAAAAGCIVIDNTSQFRMEPDVPLVVPEVNPEALTRIRRGIIANPNCSTIQMVVALKPLHDKYRVKRVQVSTYQSVSGAGKDGMDELWTQSRAMFVHDAVTPQEFTKQIAYNCIPHIDRFMDDGSTKEEWKMVVETRKILDPDLQGPRDLRPRPRLRRSFRGGEHRVRDADHRRRSPRCPARGARCERAGHPRRRRVTRLRWIAPGRMMCSSAASAANPTVQNGLSFWCVSDNLRKGAALKCGADRRGARLPQAAGQGRLRRAPQNPALHSRSWQPSRLGRLGTAHARRWGPAIVQARCGLRFWPRPHNGTSIGLLPLRSR